MPRFKGDPRAALGIRTTRPAHSGGVEVQKPVVPWTVAFVRRWAWETRPGTPSRIARLFRFPRHGSWTPMTADSRIAQSRVSVHRCRDSHVSPAWAEDRARASGVAASCCSPRCPGGAKRHRRADSHSTRTRRRSRQSRREPRPRPAPQVPCRGRWSARGPSARTPCGWKYHGPVTTEDHLRTSNPIESVFATVRHRTVRTKGALSQDTARLMVFKLVMAAAKTWHRLKGENQLPKSSRVSHSVTACQWRLHSPQIGRLKTPQFGVAACS